MVNRNRELKSAKSNKSKINSGEFVVIVGKSGSGKYFYYT